MTKFETFKERISAAVSIDDVEVKTAMLEEVQAPGFWDGFTEIEIYVLKTGISDLRRTRYEVALEQARDISESLEE